MKENIIIKREIQKMYELYNTNLSSGATTGKCDSAKTCFDLLLIENGWDVSSVRSSIFDGAILRKCLKKVPSQTFERVLNASVESIHTPTAIYISAFITDTCTCTSSPTTSSEVRSWDLVLWKSINDSNN